MARRFCYLIGAKRKDVGEIPTVGPSVIICVVNAQMHNTIMLRGVKMNFKPACNKFSGMKPIKFTQTSIYFSAHCIDYWAGLSLVAIYQVNETQ